MTQTYIDICLCTFRRPQVADTLRSLAELITKPEWSLRIIVADNDETPSAKIIIEETIAATNIHCTYIHAPARNISTARNACLSAATAPLIAFLDDDEIATPEWLLNLTNTLNSSNSDIILGPVRALYPDNAPRWMTQGNFHSTRPFWIKKQITTGYTCNVLFRRSIIGDLQFRTDLGQSGGEDTAFFSSLFKKGHSIAYAPEAWLNESVPPNRASLLWLLKRRFRAGQVTAMLRMEEHPTLWLYLGQYITKCSICISMACITILSPTRRNYWLLRGTLHLGAITNLLGKKVIKQYG